GNRQANPPALRGGGACDALPGLEREDLRAGLRRNRLAACRRDQSLGHRLMHDLVKGKTHQITGLGECCELFPSGRIAVEPSLNVALLRHFELAVEIGDEPVVTALLHPSYSCASRHPPRAAAATRCARGRDGS